MTPRSPLRWSRRPAVVCAATALLAASACTSGESDLAGEDAGSTDPAVLSITPEDGTDEIRPNEPITVTAESGTITDVTVEQAGGSGESLPMTGTLNGDENEWVSDWTLVPGADVVVTATGENGAGEATEVVSQFTTLEATEGRRLEFKADTVEQQLLTDGPVGVGMPIMIDFDMPVENREQVEAAMEVTSEKPAQGAWNWFGDKRAVFRTEDYWEPNQTVTVDLHLAGVEASDGVYGVEDTSIEFEVGRSQITDIDEDESHMVVESDGETVKEFPVSLGMATTRAYTTTSGVHLTMGKFTNFRMSNDTMGVPKDSPEWYEEYVAHAVQISNSGEFLHTADWNYQLGEANTSHGCVNMSVEDSQWFYDNSLPGDPVLITGTDRELEVDNGWGFWQRSWDDWVAESAVGEADDTGEAGVPGSPHIAE
ncbi:Ig-like domain-containing protein [Nocardiopsis mangrovi]|uniref:Ig-like domain-containing protein n=1 Tax=Nocardiopsis mangrovi TaxID=1179818 RepID=A0ABV9E151_9ACTN